ncbi:hypothetical protein D3C73_1533130 [compost metagenome]
MIMSFFAGLMWIDIKYIVATKAPFFAYINPAHLISDAFYSLYYYDTYERFFVNIGLLAAISFVFYILVFLVVRRQKYASV